MALIYTIRCDGYYGPGRPDKGHLYDCPYQAQLSGSDLVRVTAHCVTNRWRLGRNRRDHCAACWPRVAQHLNLKQHSVQGESSNG
jgi:hypothetical protein